jgi:hypothetical protein
MNEAPAHFHTHGFVLLVLLLGEGGFFFFCVPPHFCNKSQRQCDELHFHENMQVNLRAGVAPNEDSDTCTAGIGTLILEFGVISLLTNDMTFFDVADQVCCAFWQNHVIFSHSVRWQALDRLWKLRSKRGLFGNTLDGRTGQWTNPLSGIGAGIDSFYEYLLKAHILFGDSKFLKMVPSDFFFCYLHTSNEYLFLLRSTYSSVKPTMLSRPISNLDHGT